MIFPAGDEVANVVLNKYGTIDYEWGIKSASTDFVSKLFLDFFFVTDHGVLKGECDVWYVNIYYHLRFPILLVSSSISASWIWYVHISYILTYLNFHGRTYISAIPTIKDGGNHTPGFTDAAATIKAHYACLDVSKALAATGIRVLTDDDFLARVGDLSDIVANRPLRFLLYAG